jgi:poly(A) polymerase
LSRNGDKALIVFERALAFALGRTPPPAVQLSSESIPALAGDVVRGHVESILLAPRPERGLQQLYVEGLLEVWLPEVAALVGFGEGDRRHKDVWDHSKRVVAQSPPEPSLRWAALLHDIGKVSTRQWTADGQVHFHGHAETGSRLASKVLMRLCFSRDEARRIYLLILFHQRPSQYESSWTDSAVRRFARETDEVLTDLLALSRADMTTRFEGKRLRGQGLLDELAERIEVIRELDARVPPLPKGLGTSIMAEFNIPPGPRVGQLRAAVEAAVERGELEPRREDRHYLDWLSQHLEEHEAP